MAITSKMTIETSDVTRGMQKVKQEVKQTAKEVSNAGKEAQSSMNAASKDSEKAFGTMTGNVKIFGTSLKDLGNSFSSLGSSMASWAVVGVAAVKAVIEVIKLYIKNMRAAEDAQKALKWGQWEQRQNIKKENADTSKSNSDLIKQYIDLENSGDKSRVTAVRKQQIKREIEVNNHFLKENDRVSLTDANGNQLSVEGLAKQRAKALDVERTQQMSYLEGVYAKNAQNLAKAQKKYDALQDDGFITQLIGAGLQKIDIFDQMTDESYADMMKRLPKEINEAIEAMRKAQNEWIRLEASTPGRDSMVAFYAQQTDKKFKDRKEAQEKQDAISKANAEVDEQKALIALTEEERKRAELLAKVNKEYEENIQKGVTKEKAEELRKARIDAFDKARADAKTIATLNAEKDAEIGRETDPYEKRRLQLEREREELYNKYIDEGVDPTEAKRYADEAMFDKFRSLYIEKEKHANTLSNSLKDKPSDKILTNDLIKQGAGLGIQTTDYSRMTMDLVKQIKEQMNKMLPYMAKVSNKI